MKVFALFAFPILSLMLVALSHLGQAQDLALSPAPPPTSDGTAIDQGVAYVLMMVALAITYMIH
ncbi:Arabinogalactan peptide 20 [Senna tora]|uniref:Arabinogalactan peptide 20 n=1 Tax=Senna tora TaxID=362788 RepID=A0A834T0X3_9FABA|nr:Arabinogalactan peptide 20 [Senna tora]